MYVSVRTELSLPAYFPHVVNHKTAFTGASADCSKDLFITAPQKMEALSGSCLIIPCNFRTKSEGFSSTRKTFGVWIKNDSRFSKYPNNVIFSSSRTVNIYPMKITGNLSKKNCTTVFSDLTTTHTDTYYFRIENDPFKATASCDPLQITVKDSAPSPVIKIPGDVKEKESVTITCSALTPCPHSPPKLTWTLQQDPHTNTEENTDGTFTTKIQENITLSDGHDGLNISCSATYPVNGGWDVRTAETQEKLRVPYAPKDTSASISPSGLVSAGTWVNLSCSSRAQPPVSSFTWFKSSKDGARTVSEGAFYSFNATQGGVYYCVAANGVGNQTSAQIQLIIGGTQLGPLVGGLIVVFVLICVFVAIWWLKSKHRSPQTQFSQSPNDPAPQQPETTTGEETIHYGEINFSSPRPEPPSHSVQDFGQDTLYSQVAVSERANILTQTSDGPDNLYAEVKKK